MAVDGREFAASLRDDIRARRSFGGHPLWHAIESGRVDRPGLATFAVQFFLQVNEFPRALSALHSRCGDRAQRRRLAESLYEEETGVLSRTKPHPELFLDFCTALGLSREAVVTAAPLPSTAALIHWFEFSTKLLPFVEGVAATTLAAEGQVAGAFGRLARALERHYGLPAAAVAFWDVHEVADAEHSDVGDGIVVAHAATGAARAGIRRAVHTSLAMWWQFFDGIERTTSG